MISFEKYHGNGNDFLFMESGVLNHFSSDIQLREFAIKLCNRNFGVGADGIVFCDTSKNEILITNSDGSFAATCGNALRCYGLKLLLQGEWDGKSFVAVKRLVPVFLQHSHLEDGEEFVTSCDEIFATLIEGNALIKKVCVAMGVERTTQIHNIPPSFCGLTAESVIGLNQCVYVQLANPHLVFINSNFAEFDEEKFKQFGQWAQGELLEFFSDKIPICNISMLYLKEDTWNLQVYERGAGLTLCCGSGAVASLVALETLQYVKKNSCSFNLKGGGVDIGIKDITGRLERTLTGSAECVYKGNIPWY